MIAIKAAFGLIPGWVYAIIVGILVSALTFSSVRVATLKTEVSEARLETEQLRATYAANYARAAAQARARERILLEQTERIAREHQKREEATAARAAAALRTAASLRDRIATLSSRPAPADPVAASFDREARLARELLGACADRYQRVAEEADGLRDTVIGLQAWAGSLTQGQETDGR